MAKNKKNQQQSIPSILVNDFTLVAPDRNRKDVGMLINALRRAEDVYRPNRYLLYDLYKYIVDLDGHLSGIVRKRTDSVLNKNIQFLDKEGHRVDAFESLIGSNKFNRLIELMMESKYWGVSTVEFIPGTTFDFVEIPRKHVRPEIKQIVKSQYDTNGYDINELPWVWMIGEPGNLGILLQCSMYALYKRSGFGDFAQYVEIFGQPVRIIYYDAYDTKTKDELRKLLHESGSSLSMMVPKQAKFEMLDGKTSNGTGELQQRLITMCNEEMSIAVLGNSETTTSSSSSGYAQAKEHGKQQLEITKSDLTFVRNMLNNPHFLDILKSYGYPVDGGTFEVEIELDLDTLEQRIKIDLQVAQRVPIDDDYWYDTYGIPKPSNYDQLKAQQEEQRQVMLKAIKSDKKEEEIKEEEGDNKKKNLVAELSDFFGTAPL